MKEIQPIERAGMRVLTTSQLAEAYGTDSRYINNNFQRNSSRYVYGKHYFEVRGEELRELKEGSHQIEGNLKYAPMVYLWTEKGAWLHAKSLNTDKAWEAYEMLVDDYYKIKEAAQFDISGLSPILQALIQTEQRQKELEARQLKSEEQVEIIKETFLKRDENWRSRVNGLLTGAARSRGGDYQEIRNKSYNRLEDRAHCNLKIRLNNMKDRAFEGGTSKTSIEKMNRLDVIESDPKLKEIYETIVKELSLSRI